MIHPAADESPPPDVRGVEPPHATAREAEVCDCCGSLEVRWLRCKLICLSCKAIVKSCADL